MDLIFAIMWYLQLIFLGNTYTAEEFNDIFYQNEVIINDVASDPVMSNEAIIQFHDAGGSDAKLVETWDEDPPELEFESDVPEKK